LLSIFLRDPSVLFVLIFVCLYFNKHKAMLDIWANAGVTLLALAGWSACQFQPRSKYR